MATDKNQIQEQLQEETLAPKNQPTNEGEVTQEGPKYAPMTPIEEEANAIGGFDSSLAPYRLDLVKKGLIKKSEEVNQLQRLYNYKNQAEESRSSLGSVAAKLSTTNELAKLSDTHALVGSTLIPRFTSFVPGSDNNERLALRQGAGEKILNGVGKMFATAGTTFGGMTVGAITSLGNWMFNGMTTEALRTDSFNMWLDDINERLNYTLPNYVSEEESQRGFLGTLATVNFWANDVANGIGFLGGAMLGNLAFGGLGATSSFTRAGLRLGARGGTSTRAAQKMLTGSAKKAASKDLMATAKKLGSEGLRLSTREASYARAGRMVGSVVDQARFLYTNAAYQGSIESRQAMKEAEEQFYAYHEAMGTEPTKEEIAQFEKDAIKAGNWIYGFNLPLVGMTNMAILGKMFKIPSLIPKSATRSFQRTFMGIGTKLEKNVRVKLKPNRAQNIFGHAYSFGRGAVYLGLGELPMQRVFRESGKNWLESGYDPDSTMEAYDIGGSVGEAFADAYGSPEGWREMASGLVIGFIGGGVGGQFGSYSQAKKNVESYVENANKEMYSAEVARDRVFMYNQMVNATKAEADAEAKGEYAAAKRAREAAMLAPMEFHEAHGMGETFLEDFEMSVDLAENSKIAEEYGIPLEEVNDFKTKVKEEFRDLQSRYQSNRNLAIDLLGRGHGYSDLAEKYKIVPYIAYNFTMGENSNKVASDIMDTIIAEIHNRTNIASETDLGNAAQLKKTLDRASEESRNNYENKKREVAEIQKEADRLITEIRNKQGVYERMEDAQEKARLSSELQRLADELNKAQERENQAKAEVEAIFKTMQLENPFKDGEGTARTLKADELAKAEETMVEIDKYLRQMEGYDAKSHRKLTDLMDEYSKSVYAFTEYKKTVQDIISPEFDPGNFTTKLSKSMNGKLSNEFTKKFYQRVGEQYMNAVTEYTTDIVRDKINKGEFEVQEEDSTEAQERSLDELVQDKSEFEQEQREGDRKKVENIVEDEASGRERNSQEDTLLKNTYPKTYAAYQKAAQERVKTEEAKNYLQRLVETAKKALDKSRNIGYYIGENIEDADARRPSQEELNEYQDLYERRNELNAQETERFNELNNKIADWQVQDGIMIDGFEGTLADLVERISQLSQEIQQQEVVKEITPEHAITIEEAGEKNTSSTVENHSMLQDQEADARVKFDKSGKVFISHVTPTALLNHFSEVVTEVVIKTEEGEVVLKPSEFNQIESLSQEGATFTVKMGETAVTFEVGDMSRIVLSPENMDSLASNSDLVFKASNVDPQSRSNSWLLLYRTTSAGQVVPVKSSFTNPTSRKTPIQKLSNSEKSSLQGKKLSLKVDPHNHYNRMLLEDVMEAKEAYEAAKEEGASKETLKELGAEYQKALRNLENNIVIEAMYQNKTGGQLRAKRRTRDSESNQRFSKIRQIAAKKFMDRMAMAEGVRDVDLLIDLGSEVPVGFTYSGSPVFILRNTDAGVELAPRDITDKDLRVIKDAGYAVNGEVTLGKTPAAEVETTYLDKTDSRTVPVVVLEYSGKLIAFPVTLKGQQKNLVQEAETIMESFSESPAKTINKLNQLLIENGLDPNQFELRERDIMNATENFGNFLEVLENHSSYTNVHKWAESNFDLAELKEEAQTVIDITNSPFSSPKSRLAFSEAEITNVRDRAEDQFMENERISEVTSVFNDLWNMVETPVDYAPNNKFTRFVDAFSGQNKPRGYIQKVGYINDIGSKILTLGGKGGKFYQNLYGENFLPEIKSKIREAANRGYLPTLKNKLEHMGKISEEVNNEISEVIKTKKC